MYNESFQKVSCHVFFVLLEMCLTFLILEQSQRVIKNSQRVKVLRKPPQQPDDYLPSWPHSTHCARAWPVVIDPFNSSLERAR